jgi:hypothetical protein
MAEVVGVSVARGGQTFSRERTSERIARGLKPPQLEWRRGAKAPLFHEERLTRC